MGAIDADAHVIETVETWSYLEADERRFTPQLMTQTFGAELRSNGGNLWCQPCLNCVTKIMSIVRERQGQKKLYRDFVRF